MEEEIRMLLGERGVGVVGGIGSVGILRLRPAGFAQNDRLFQVWVGEILGRAFSPWVCGGVPTQGAPTPADKERPLGSRFGLGWDVAAPLALRWKGVFGKENAEAVEGAEVSRRKGGLLFSLEFEFSVHSSQF
jgi:hypothetical protein